MATKAMETAGSLDQATLDALRESIAAVLAEQSGSTAVHAFIDGKNSLDRELWSQAGLPWLAWIRHSGAVRRPRTGCPRPRHPAYRDLDGKRRRDRISPPSQPHRRSSKAALTRFARRGCRGSRPVKSARRCRPRLGATA